MENTSLSKNWDKLKSWFKKKTKEANAITKEKPVQAFKPKFIPTSKFIGNPIWFGTNANRKKKTNKIHRSRITKRKHCKAKAA
jgi:hypothetical protein